MMLENFAFNVYLIANHSYNAALLVCSSCSLAFTLCFGLKEKKVIMRGWPRK